MVYDGGTLEHVFNFPQALKNCMQMVRLGGCFTQLTVANNFMGHGFWQISPELLYRSLSEENGYRVETVMLHEVIRGGGWYVASDPEEKRRRVELVNHQPTYIVTIAKRVAIKDVFAAPPQQSDYAAAWKNGAYSPGLVAEGSQAPGRRLAWLKRLIPGPVKRILKKAMPEQPVEEFDPSVYRRVEEADLLRGRLG